MMLKPIWAIKLFSNHPEEEEVDGGVEGLSARQISGLWSEWTVRKGARLWDYVKERQAARSEDDSKKGEESDVRVVCQVCVQDPERSSATSSMVLVVEYLTNHSVVNAVICRFRDVKSAQYSIHQIALIG